MRRLAVLAVVLAAVFAGWSGVTWWRGASEVASARDEALRSGRSAIAVLNTLDYRSVDEGLRRWLDASTGSLRAELAEGRDRLAAARTVTVGRVFDAAVTEVEPARGTARLIASVAIEVTPEGGEPATKWARQQADLVRTAGGWKISALGQVP